MNKKDFETVVNLIIDEDFNKANALISKIMEQKTVSIYKQRLIEDGDIETDNKESEEVVNTDDETSTVEDETTAENNPESSPEEIKYQFIDIQKDFDRLKSEFAKILGTDLDVDTDVTTDIDTDIDTTDTDIEEDVYDSSVPNENDEASPLTYANESEEDLECDDDIFNEDDINDISEALELSTVKVDMKNPKEAGTGKSVKTDDKSFISSKEGEKGEPIQIKSSGEPKGTGRQPSPAVKNPSYKSTNVMDLKTVSKEGDKTAKLNSTDGFGKSDEDSPLSKIKR